MANGPLSSIACLLVALGASPLLACPEDTDRDGVCDGIDNCPTVLNAEQSDLDGDLVGDRCDDQDATLEPRTLVVKADTSDSADNGSVRVRGSVEIALPGDRLFFSEGLLLRISDGSGFEETDVFQQGACGPPSSGRWVCLKNDHAGQATFRQQRATPTVWRFAVTVKRLAITGPFGAAPITVAIRSDGGIDRVGTVAPCVGTPTKLVCKAP
jgi:hypothetical protein